MGKVQDALAQCSTQYGVDCQMYLSVGVAIAVILLFALGGARKGAPRVVTWSWYPFSNMVGFMKPVDMMRELYKRHGSVFTLSIFGNRLTFLLGVESQTAFFAGKDDVLDQAEVYQFMTSVFGKGVVYDATPSIRLQQLKFFAECLRTKNLKGYVPHFVEEAEAIFSEWGNEGTVELKSELARLTILTASRCLLGADIRATMSDKIGELFHLMDLGINPISFFSPNFPMPAHWRRNAARKELSGLFAQVIAKRRALEAQAAAKGEAVAGEGEDDTGFNIIQKLMHSQYKDGSKVTDDQICGVCVAALFAGQHTSSLTICWVVLLVLKHPTVYARVLAEQDAALAKAGGTLCFEALTDMPLLQACIKEALRMYPPLIMLMRKVKKDLVVVGGGVGGGDGSCVVPAGDIVFAAPSMSRFMESDFTGSESFNPDRFSEDEAVNAGGSVDKQAYKFIGFGGGMHACMGQNFALLQLKAVLSVLFRRFDLSVEGGKFPQPDYSAMVVGPEGDVNVRFKLRKGVCPAVAGGGAAAAAGAGKAGKADKASAAAADAAAAGGGASTGKSFTLAEVAKHNKPTDAWIIVDGRVYDISSYVDEHPGGDEILKNVGADSREGFHGPQHPAHVAQVLKAFCIGDVKH